MSFKYSLGLLLFTWFLSPNLLAQERISGTYNSESKRFEVAAGPYQVKPFREGLAVFGYNGDYGIIDTSGKVICPLRYQEIEGFSGGISLVSTFVDGTRRFGFIDRSGREIVPVQYEYADYLFDRSIRVPGALLVRKNNLYTVYDYQGKLLVAERFSSINEFAYDRSLVFADGKYGYLNRDWKEVIPLQFEEAKPFVGGRAMVKKEGLWGIIDVDGNTVLDFKYEALSSIQIQGLLKAKSAGLYGIISESGIELIAPVYTSLHNYKEGRMAALRDGKYGYINLKGEVLIPHQYEWASDFSQGRAMAKYHGKWGHIDTLNNIITPFEYDKTGPFSQGFAYVQKGDLYGRINLAGDLIIPVAYHGMGHFVNGLASVVKREGSKKLRGLVDTTGMEVVPCEYEEIRALSDGFRAVQKEGLWGFVNEEGKLVIPWQYLGVDDFSGDKARVHLKGEAFEIDKKGKRI